MLTSLRLRSSSLFFFFFFAFFFLFFFSSSSHATTFNLHDFLAGEWDVVETEIDTSSSSSFTPSSLVGHYVFSKDNSTATGTDVRQRLIGSYSENDTSTGMLGNELAVAVTFDSSSQGTWAIGAADDALHVLFAFDVRTWNGGYPSSSGVWTTEEEGGSSSGGGVGEKSFYLMQIIQPDRFTITVTHPKASSITLYSLKKRVPPVEKTFFQSYGTYLMLGVFFVINMYIKSKSATWGQAAATTSAPAIQASATTAAAKKNK